VILTLWLALLALSFGVMILGYFTDDEPYLSVGLFFLFLLSLIVLGGNLDYQTGADRTGNFAFLNSTVDNTSTITTFSYNETVTYEYTSWDDTTSHRVGWGLAIISMIGFTLSLYQTRKRRMNAND